MTASIQRQAISLRISVTDQCQLRCAYCMPAEGAPRRRHSNMLSYEEIIRFVRAVSSRFVLTKVHITGGEPLVRPGIVDFIAALAAERIPDLALTTNGQLLADMAPRLTRAGLRRVNISLDSLNAATYAMLTRGGDIEGAIKGIKATVRAGLAPVKVNTVVLRGCNDDEVCELARFALDHDCVIRFLEMMPIGCARETFHDLFVQTSETRARLEDSFGLKPLAHEPGRSSRDFAAVDSAGRRGTIGFISPNTKPFCRGCTRLRLLSNGRLVSCLARGNGRNVRHLLGEDSPQAVNALLEQVSVALAQKRGYPVFRTLRPMAAVGG